MTTIEKVKSYLEITSSNYDTVISQLISNVDSFLKKTLGREFTKEERTEYFDGGVKHIVLKEYPIDSSQPLAVYYNSHNQSNPSWNEIDSSNYVVYDSEGILEHYGKFPSGKRNIKVVYTGGYSEIPDDLELLAKQLVAKIFERRKASGKSSESLNGARIDWEKELTPEQKMIIDSYKVISF